MQGARLRAIARRRGGPWLQRRVWDWEFRTGRWEYLKRPGEDAFQSIVERHLGGGRLLDLGCGHGTARRDMASSALRGYVGVDISREAIRQATALTADLPPLLGDQRFVEGDIADPAVLRSVGDNFDVVMLRESIYYIKVEALGAFIQSLGPLLCPSGVVVVWIWDRLRYASHVTALHRYLDIVEEHQQVDKKSVFLVGRPGTDSS